MGQGYRSTPDSVAWNTAADTVPPMTDGGSFNLDGRTFASRTSVDGGEVGPETVFKYHEAGGEIWAWESRAGAGTSVVEEVVA